MRCFIKKQKKVSKRIPFFIGGEKGSVYHACCSLTVALQQYPTHNCLAKNSLLNCFLHLRTPSAFESPSCSTEQKKVSKRIPFFIGGEKGLRTPEWVLAITRFPIVRLRPAQPSLQACISIYARFDFVKLFLNIKASKRFFL